MSMIDQVSDVREDFRGLLRRAVAVEDPILEEEALKGSSKQFGEDSIISLAMSILVRLSPSDEKPSLEQLVKAVAILDDLDTLGMEVRFKK